jgi:hypothetical protein
MAGDRSVVQGHVDGGQHPVVIETDIERSLEVVPLAGHDHVLVAVGPRLDRAPGLHRRQGSGGREQRGLGLLAAEATAHAAHLDHHGRMRNLEHLCDQMLHLAGMLG